MARFQSLGDAVRENLRRGDSVAMEGFTHLIPFAAGHEVIRQGVGDLTLIRMTPDLIYDQMIGMGLRPQAESFRGAATPGVGSLYRFRDAVEHGWPHPLEIEEHSHAAMANAYAAGAAGMPSAFFRGYRGAELATVNSNIRFIDCPFTGEPLACVPAHRPDVAIIHAQRADRHGNVLLEGIVGVQKEAVLARSARWSPSRRSSTSFRHQPERRDPAALDRHRYRRRRPEARTLPTRTATTRATTRSTSPGTRSRATATTFLDWMKNERPRRAARKSSPSTLGGCRMRSPRD